VKKVAFEDMQSPPYKARVTLHVYIASDHSEIKRDMYTAIRVRLKTNVPNELIPINPLGLAITYFREDQALVSAMCEPLMLTIPSSWETWLLSVCRG